MQQERRPRQEGGGGRRRRRRGGRRARGDVRSRRWRHLGALAAGLLIFSHFYDLTTRTHRHLRSGTRGVRSTLKWTDTRTLESFWRATEEC